MKFFRSNIFFLLVSYFLLLAIYSFFSYALTAPNLVLSSWEPYWEFQTYMWETFFNNRELLTQAYLLIILLLFITYFFIIKSIKKYLPSKLNAAAFAGFFIICLPLLLSNNALSYDVFNYMFNAKAVVLYGANPHLQIPLDFPNDLWLRFMHNTHSTAPYGYAWTAISLIPYTLGLGKFLPTWVLFRLFSFLSIILLFFSLKLFAQKFNLKPKTYHYAILFLNPLFLIEVISNSHNDLWMILPAITSLALVNKFQISNSKSQINFKSIIPKILLSLLLLAFSVSIKMATLVLIPIWFFLVFKNLRIKYSFGIFNFAFELINKHIALLSSVALFIPLLTERSKQFLPWYLLWSLVWIPILLDRKVKYWAYLLLIFSFTAMLRYLPFLWMGTYEGLVPVWEKILLWSALPLCLIFYFTRKITNRLRT